MPLPTSVGSERSNPSGCVQFRLGDLYKKQNPIFEVRRGLDSTFIVSAAGMARTHLPDNSQEREVFIKEQQLDSMSLSKRDFWDLL